MWGRHFTVTPSVNAGRHTLMLAGELDLASGPVLQQAVTAACDEGASELVLDLAGLHFADLSGLRAIVAAKARCEHHQCDFTVRHEPRQFRRLLDLVPLLGPRPFYGRRDHEMTRVLQERRRVAPSTSRLRRPGVPRA